MSKKDEERWSHKETIDLLAIVQERNLANNSDNKRARNAQMYSEVVKDLNAKGHALMTVSRVKDKWKRLKKRYNKIIADLNLSGSGSESVRWPYFSIMNEILKGRPRVQAMNAGVDTFYSESTNPTDEMTTVVGLVDPLHDADLGDDEITLTLERVPVDGDASSPVVQTNTETSESNEQIANDSSEIPSCSSTTPLPDLNYDSPCNSSDQSSKVANENRGLKRKRYDDRNERGKKKGRNAQADFQDEMIQVLKSESEKDRLVFSEAISAAANSLVQAIREMRSSQN